jgi:hypothetical protein
MLSAAIRQNVPTYTSNAESGVWRGRNARNAEISPSLSEYSQISLRISDSFSLRAIRQKCPNSLIAREFDQILTSMK